MYLHDLKFLPFKRHTNFIKAIKFNPPYQLHFHRDNYFDHLSFCDTNFSLILFITRDM